MKRLIYWSGQRVIELRVGGGAVKLIKSQQTAFRAPWASILSVIHVHLLSLDGGFCGKPISSESSSQWQMSIVSVGPISATSLSFVFHDIIKDTAILRPLDIQPPNSTF